VDNFRHLTALSCLAFAFAPVVADSSPLAAAATAAAKAAQAPAAQAPQTNGRALPSPLPSPPFPDSDWLGFPLIGAPWSGSPSYPLEKALFRRPLGKDIHLYGWLNPSYNASSSRNVNAPLSYAFAANRAVLDQAVLVFEKQPDTVQTDHVDTGFRLVTLAGTNYRYTIMKGILSDQFLKHNSMYGFDPVEMYGMIYYPKVAEGLVIRYGRYISPPDIEAQLTPDNYMYSHSLMFSVDPYTFVGINPMLRLNKQWEIMGQVHAGNDIAPWNDSASLNFGLMARWTSLDGKDGLWGGINSLGQGRVRHQHDNLQQVVETWGHKFNEKLHMMTEAYYMWEYGGNLGGTAINGPVQFGTGGGAGAFLPGRSVATGYVNYFQILTSPKDYVSIRTDYLGDFQGYRTGYPTPYFSETLAYVRYLTPMIMFRPEVRYETAIDKGINPYDSGTRHQQWTISADLVVRF